MDDRKKLTAYPPDFIGPLNEGYRCNEGEWVASILQKGDRCWFRKKIRPGPKRHCVPGCENCDPTHPFYTGMTSWQVGTFMSAMFYDGVIARVYEDDPDDLITHSLFCDFGDELRATAP